MLKFLILVLLYFIKDASTDCDADNKKPWSYHGSENNPNYWGDKYPDCKEGDQSPIDITLKDSLTFTIWGYLKYKGFDKDVTKATVENLGWTVRITPEDDVERTVTWNENTLTLKNIQFHFDKSEHIIKGKQYSMEIHFLLHNKWNGSLFLASFMDGSPDDNESFDPITDILSDVKYKGDSTELKSDLDLLELLPGSDEYSDSYFLYAGSYTIPPCDPTTWFILEDVGKIGNNQLNSFMSLYSVGKDDASDDCLMGPNNRPTQKLGEDKIVHVV